MLASAMLTGAADGMYECIGKASDILILDAMVTEFDVPQVAIPGGSAIYMMFQA